MEESILISTKKILGLAKSYTAFDLDVITHINAAFSVLSQLGLGPAEGFMIEDDGATWDEFPVPLNQSNLLKTYIYLKVRMAFDPPATSFAIAAMEKQSEEYEWRLSTWREWGLHPVDPLTEVVIPESEEVII